MQRFEGMRFDAVGIEYAFARILGRRIGARGKSNDADVFRGGEIRHLGVLIEDTANSIEERVNRLSFNEEDSTPGGRKTIIDSSVRGLREIASAMRRENSREPDQYHWLIIRDLINVINGLLEKLEQ